MTEEAKIEQVYKDSYDKGHKDGYVKGCEQQTATEVPLRNSEKIMSSNAERTFDKIRNSKAVASLVFGIIALEYPFGLWGLMSGAAATFFGIIAKGKIHKSRNTKGQKKASWGIVLGITAIVISAIFFVLTVNTHGCLKNLVQNNPHALQWYSTNGIVEQQWILGGLNPNQTEIQQESRGRIPRPIGFVENWGRTDWLQKNPFQPFSIAKTIDVYRTTRRLQKDESEKYWGDAGFDPKEGKTRDQRVIEEYLLALKEVSVRGKTFWARVGDELVPVMVILVTIFLCLHGDLPLVMSNKRYTSFQASIPGHLLVSLCKKL